MSNAVKASNAVVANAANPVAVAAENATKAVNAAAVAAENANKAIAAVNEAAANVVEVQAVPAEVLAEAVGVPANPRVEEVFSNVIKNGKFALLALLLIMSFINGHKEYIAENPRKFMWDNFTVGATSAIAIAIIANMRGRPDLIKNLAFVSFLLFFVYNVFRELSGFNAITDPAKLTQGEAKQANVMKMPIMIIIGIAVVVVLGLALVARVAHPLGFGRLAQEAAIFASFTAFAEIIVAANHGEDAKHIALTGLANFVMFFLAHIILQYGGFYNHVFAAGEAVLHQD